jgi:nucleoside-diphosphate-sugar epimerase
VPAAFVTGGSGFVGTALIRRLAADGWTVRALARSALELWLGGRRRAEANSDDHLYDDALERAARAAGVQRLVHVGTEAALMHGQPLVAVDERYPLALRSRAPYSATKAAAEAAVNEANGNGLETVVVRPRFVWGAGDTTLLPVLVAMARSGRLRWVGGGRQLTSTTHVANTVEGLVLAAGKGVPGNAYFVTDGSPVVFREFVSALLATQGVQAPEGDVPLPFAGAVARVSETLWRVLPLPGEPPVASFAVWASGLEATIDDTKAREQLGYRPVMTRDHGLTAMQAVVVH